jgi:hypothetical protein
MNTMLLTGFQVTYQKGDLIQKQGPTEISRINLTDNQPYLLGIITTGAAGAVRQTLTVTKGSLPLGTPCIVTFDETIYNNKNTYPNCKIHFDTIDFENGGAPGAVTRMIALQGIGISDITDVKPGVLPANLFHGFKLGDGYFVEITRLASFNLLMVRVNEAPFIGQIRRT